MTTCSEEDEKERERLCILLCELDQRLQRIEERLNLIEVSTRDMTRHIGFVEGVWNMVRSPFQYLIGAEELPEALPPRVSESLLLE